jgi:hypothetical protein
MIEEKYNWSYEDFFKGENIETSLSGILSVAQWTLDGTNEEYYFLCENWECFSWNKVTWCKRTNWDYYIAARCIQE